ncbi:hydrogenase maturation protease [Syntrophorhabdus aromaticivorans]|uniref:hydrogenase maturation protease n=1 Tax=Syntrophorhabdus aromaticivorans TaxID=328301 RepID=UPI00041C5639|nr:hydrogenase maturation protease [Syntrophorhabdus aromaticivorans]
MRNKTLVIGLGNPILGDDAAGIWVAREILCREEPLPNVDVVEACAGGLDLLDLMEGYGSVIIADAIQTAETKTGAIYELALDDLGAINYSWNQRNLNLRSTIDLGRRIGYAVPEHITIYGIGIVGAYTFSETLSKEVGEAVHFLAELIIERIPESGVERLNSVDSRGFAKQTQPVGCWR